MAPGAASSVGITVLATSYVAEESCFDSRQGHMIHIFYNERRPAVKSTQPPFRGYWGALFPGVNRPGVKLSAELHLAQRLRMRGAIPPLPHTLPRLEQKSILPKRTTIISIHCTFIVQLILEL